MNDYRDVAIELNWFAYSCISWPGMIDNDPDLGVCMSWEEENPPEDVPPVS